MWEYLKIEGNLWLDEVRAGDIIKHVDSAAALSNSTTLRAKLDQIAKALSGRAKTEAGVMWRYFWVWEKWNTHVKKLVAEYDGKIQASVTEFKTGWQKDVTQLMASLDIILSSAGKAEGKGLLANLHNNSTEQRLKEMGL